MGHIPTNMTAQTVLVVGNLVLDMTPVFPERGRPINMSDFVPGRLLQMNGIQVHAGGVCGNVGMALAALQTDVTITAIVGEDEFSDILSRKLMASGVNINCKKSGQTNTSYSIVIAPPGIDRIFLHDPGVSDYFETSSVTDESLRSSQFLHFGYPPLMRKIYQDDGESLADLFRRAKQFGLYTSLDMAFIDPNSRASEANWNTILSKTLPYVDFFLPSIDDMASIFFEDRYKARLTGQALSLSNDLLPLAKKIKELGAKNIVIKCGEAGIYYCGEEGKTEGFCDAFAPDKVVSANGAGDAAIAGFISAIIRGHSLEQSVACAAAAGALSVASYDTVSALITFKELSLRMANGWGRIHSIQE